MTETENNIKSDAPPVDNSLQVITPKRRIGGLRAKRQGLVSETRDAFKLSAFVQAYVSNGFNGRRAALAVSPNITDKAADSYAARVIQKPEVKQAILEASLPLDADIAIIKQALKAKKEKSIKWSDVHKFVDTSLRLKGLNGKTEEGNKVNIGLVFN